MAYLAPTYDQYGQTDEERQRAQQEQAGAAQAGSSPVGSPSAATAPSSGQYTDLRAYLEANKEQAGKMAGGMAGKVEGDIRGASEAQRQSAADWEQKARGTNEAWRKKNDAAYNAWLVGQQEELRKAHEATQASAQAEASRGMFDRANRARDAIARGETGEENIRRAEFQPTEKPVVEQWSPDLTAAQRASAELSALGSQEGRQALLDTMAGESGTGRTGGMSALDAMLIGGAAPAAESSLRSQYGDLLSAMLNPTAPQAPELKDVDYRTLGEYLGRQ